MQYVRKFYYMPRDNGETGIDVLPPCETLWRLDGFNFDSRQDRSKVAHESPKSFQDLPFEEQDKQLKYKKMLGILNKMTTKKFQKLIMQMHPESMDEAHSPMLAEMIFTKALSDDMFVNLYAKLCDEVSSSLANESYESFNRRLRHLCLRGFDHLLELTDRHIQGICEDVRYVFKRRLMNMMRFIGEMSCTSFPLFERNFNWDMIERLILTGEEIHLEAVYFILYTISLRCSDNSWPEDVWSTVSKVSRGFNRTGDVVSSRMRFMFLSLVEARVGVIPSDFHPTPSTSDSESNQQVSDYKGF